MFCFYGHGVHRYLHVVTHSCPTRRSSDLVPWLIGHSRRTMGIIRQNIGISLATKALFVGLTDFGMASMWGAIARSEEHTSELQSLMRISYAVFCLKNKHLIHSILQPHHITFSPSQLSTHNMHLQS